MRCFDRLDPGTAWVRETLFELINHRYTHALPTIITSNCARSDLEARIADRIAELATIVTVSAWSYRGLMRRRMEEEDGGGGWRRREMKRQCG